MAKVNSFIKAESYPTYKHARVINSRSDEFKCEVGPIFHAIEQQLFKLKWFIKYVPVELRPEYVMEHVESITHTTEVRGVVEGDDGLFKVGDEYIVTDHSQYESAFTKEMMMDGEYPLYEYMTQNLPQQKHFLDIYQRVITGKNTIHFKDIIMEIEATRMSGEMNTSLANGWMNLMSFLFECYRTGNKPTAEGLASNGFTVKIERVSGIADSSFCGFLFHPDDKILLKNPIMVILDFGWLKSQYSNARLTKIMGLYKCKALSFLYQYRGAPIIDAFARYVLRVCDQYKLQEYYTCTFMYRRMKAALENYEQTKLTPIPTGICTRMLVEDKFGIKVSDQVEIERYFSQCTTLHFNCPLLNTYLPAVNVLHYSKYVLPYDTNSLELYPTLNVHREPVLRERASLLQFKNPNKIRDSYWSVPIDT